MPLSIHADHPLRKQRIWTSGILNALYPRLLGGTIKKEPRLSATGVPPHIAIAMSLAKLEMRMEFLHDVVIAKLNSLPIELKTELMKNFQITNVTPLTEEKVKEMMASMETRLVESMLEIRTSIIESNNLANGNSRAASASDSNNVYLDSDAIFDPQQLLDTSDTRFDVVEWGNRLHCVPEGFKITG